MMEHDGDHLPIPMPITSKYIGDHHQPHPLSHHHHHLHHGLSSPHDHHHIHSSNGPTPPPASATPKDVHHYSSAGGPNHGGSVNSSKGGGGSASGAGVRYRECLKNHAASIGGTALDGCGEFMPAGEDGTMEALKCSACGCHRNFHRKEQEGSGSAGDLAVTFDYYAAAHPQHYFKPMSSGSGRKVVGQKGVLYHDYPYGQPPPLPLLPLPSPHGHPHHHHHMAPMPLGAMQATSESDEMDGGGFPSGGPTPPALMKKRFRTKFTVEQKERMLEFAERAGWRLQRTEEAVVQQFCQDIGVKRRVLKVWMHNNKHSLARRGMAVGGLDVGGAATSAGGGSDGGAHDHNAENSSNSHSHSHGDVNRAPVQIHLHPLDHHQHQQQQQRHGC